MTSQYVLDYRKDPCFSFHFNLSLKCFIFAPPLSFAVQSPWVFEKRFKSNVLLLVVVVVLSCVQFDGKLKRNVLSGPPWMTWSTQMNKRE